MIDAERLKRKMLILSGYAETVEDELNQALETHVAMLWSFNPINLGIHVSVVMIDKREIRMAQLAAMTVQNPRRQ